MAAKEAARGSGRSPLCRAPSEALVEVVGKGWADSVPQLPAGQAVKLFQRHSLAINLIECSGGWLVGLPRYCLTG